MWRPEDLRCYTLKWCATSPGCSFVPFEMFFVISLSWTEKAYLSSVSYSEKRMTLRKGWWELVQS